ncbi:hypothetical protein ABGB14_45685 [Nonomuraea sp. B10E15]
MDEVRVYGRVMVADLVAGAITNEVRVAERVRKPPAAIARRLEVPAGA